jgi:hypothetical protein
MNIRSVLTNIKKYSEYFILYIFMVEPEYSSLPLADESRYEQRSMHFRSRLDPCHCRELIFRIIHDIIIYSSFNVLPNELKFPIIQEELKIPY